MWSEVPEINPKEPCDICHSNNNVNRQQIKVEETSCLKSCFSYRQSNLCAKCESEGWWVSMADAFGRVHYLNSRTFQSQTK